MAAPITAVRPLALAVVLLAGLGGCGDTLRSILGTDKDDAPIPGERISVLTLQRTLEPDPRLADLAVKLPPPRANGEWPQAGGNPNHAMHHVEIGEALRTSWRVGIGAGSSEGSRLLASPVVAAGKVFVLDAKGRLSALDAEGGRRLWRRDLRPEGEEAESALGGGLAYEDSVLYVASGFGEVVAVAAESGEELWRRRIGIPMRAAPTVSGGRVFVVSHDNQLHALSAANGEPLWSHAGIAEDAGLLGGASPAVEGGIVIAPYSSGELFALRVENGRVVWSDTLSRSARLTPLASLSDIIGRPVIDGGQVIAISHSGRLAAIDLRSGARVWERNIAGVESPWVAGDFVYLVTTDAEVLCLSRRDGRIRWVRALQRYEDEEDKEDPIRWAGPVLAGERLIVVSSHGRALILSPYNGEVTSEFRLSDDAFVSPVVAAGTLYVLTDDGELTAFR